MPFINDIKVATAGGADQTLYTCPAGTEAAVPTIYFNARTGAAELTLKVYRQASGLTTEILEAFPVADDAPYNFPKPVMLNAGDFISFSAATNDIVGIIGVYQAGATGSAAGFNPRGAYSAIATYNTLDVVEEAGTTYIVLNDGVTGDTPPSANYMILAEKGDAGADGLGWTGGTYNAGDGTVTFASDDGLGFQTGDLRGADGTNGTDGADGLGWTGGSYNAADGTVTFASDDGLGFQTGDLRSDITTAGGTFTGDVTFSGEINTTSLNEGFASVTSTTNATTIDCEAANVFLHTLMENTTFTFSNPPATGTAYGFTLKLVQDATARTVTWPASVKWAAATAPTISTGSGEVDVFAFFTHDGGTNWYGFTAGQVLS